MDKCLASMGLLARVTHVALGVSRVPSAVRVWIGTVYRRKWIAPCSDGSSALSSNASVPPRPPAVLAPRMPAAVFTAFACCHSLPALAPSWRVQCPFSAEQPVKRRDESGDNRGTNRNTVQAEYCERAMHGPCVVKS